MRFIALVIATAAITIAVSIGLGLGASSALAAPASTTFEVERAEPTMFIPAANIAHVIERYCLDIPRPADACT